MRDNLIALAGAAVLFCGLYGLFWAVAVSKPQPAQQNAPRPEIKAPQPQQRPQVWV